MTLIDELLAQAPGSGFHIAQQIRDAASAEERARILLRLPDQLCLQMSWALGRACLDTDFALGQAFLDARNAAMCAVREPNGDMPHAVLGRLAHFRMLLARLAGVL